jgi:predicted metalloprotease with PDZ domain
MTSFHMFECRARLLDQGKKLRSGVRRPREGKGGQPVKCTERRKRREASSFVASLLAVFAAFIVLIALMCATAMGCAAATGSVGAMLGKDDHSGRLFVREVPPGMAAAGAGLRDGDEVLSIDDVPVGDMSPAEVHQRLEGKVGSKVVLAISRDGTTQRIEVVRGPLAK